MNLETLKDTLGDEKFASLKTYVDGLIAQRDVAKDESINGRKTLKKKADDQEALIGRLYEKLGIDSPEELDALPDGKGQVEATKQLEARIKRAERERDEAKAAKADLEGKFQGSRKTAAIAQAVAKHPFIDADDAAFFLERKARFEGEDLVYEGDGGKLITLDEAAAHIAATKPHLVKAAGGGGSGYRDDGGGKGKNPWSKDSFNLTEQIQLTATNPTQAAAFKAAASAA